MSFTVSDLRKSFYDSSFISHLGFEIVTFEQGSVVLKLPIKEYLLNVNHSLHGGVHASLLDTVQGMMIRSIYNCRVNTISLNVHYLAPVTAGDVYAKANILQNGYKVVTSEGILEDENQNIIAKASGIFKIIRD